MDNRTLRRRLRNLPDDYEVFVCVEDEDLELPGMLVDHAAKTVVLLPEYQKVNFDYVDFDQTEFFGHIEFTKTDDEDEEGGPDDDEDDSDLDDPGEDARVVEGECSEVVPKGEENVG